METHRKLVHRWHEPGQAHELTFSCVGRRPLLLLHDWPVLLARGLDAAAQRHPCDLVAFVFMPEHVHLLVLPKHPDFVPGDFLYALKRPVSYRIKQHLIGTNDPLLAELTIRERPGKTTFRFWQEGGGYDRNLFKDGSLESAAHYIHRNPVRRGLCDHPDEWKWSSFRFYEHPDRPADPDLPRVRGFPP